MSDGTSRVIWFKTDVDTSGMRSAADNVLKLLNGLSNDVAKEVSKIQSTIESAFDPLNKTVTNFGSTLSAAVNVNTSKAAAGFDQFGAAIKDSFKGINKDIERIDTTIRQIDMSRLEKAADNIKQKLSKAQDQLKRFQDEANKIDVAADGGPEKQVEALDKVAKAQEKVNRLSGASTKLDTFIQDRKDAADAAAKAAAAQAKADKEALAAADDLQKKLSKAFDEVNKEASKVQTTLHQMSMSKLEKEADNYRIALHDAYKEIDDLEEASKQLVLTSQQQLAIETKIRNTKERITDLEQAQAAIIAKKSAAAVGGSAGAPPDFTKTADANANAQKRVNFILDDTTRLVRNLKTDLADLGRTVMQTFQMFATVVSVPTQAFGDFQKQMLIIKQLATDFTAKELTQFEETAKRVAVTNGIMATEIAKSGIELVRLGLNAKETNMVLSQVADAALANGIAIDKAASIGLGTTKAFGLGVKDLSMVMDVLTRAAVSSATDIEGLGQTFKYAGPIFRSADQDINQLGIATAILSNNMIRNSQAGTTLRSMMVNLQKPTKEASKVLNELGVKVVDESTQKIRPFMDIVKDLSASMRNLTTDQKNASLAILFGKYALSGSSALINTTTEEVNRATKAFNDNALSAQKMAEGMRTGVNFSLDQMRASVNLAAIELGEKLSVSFQSVTNAVTNMAVSFSELPEEMQQLIADTIVMTGKTILFTSAVGALVLGLKTLQGFIVQMIPKIVALFTGAMSAINGLLVEATMLFGGTVAGGVIGLTATFAAGLLALAGVVMVLKENWNLFQANLAEKKAWETAYSGFKGLNDRIKESGNQLKTLISNYKELNKLRGLKDGKELTIEERMRIAPTTAQTAEQLKLSAWAGKITGEDLGLGMALSKARTDFDKLKAEIDALNQQKASMDKTEDKQEIDALNKIIKEKAAAMKESYNMLLEANALSKEEIPIMSAAVKARNRNLDNIIKEDKLREEEMALRKKEAEARKRQIELMKGVNESLQDTDRQIQSEYQQRRNAYLEGFLNQKSPTIESISAADILASELFPVKPTVLKKKGNRIERIGGGLAELESKTIDSFYAFLEDTKGFTNFMRDAIAANMSNVDYLVSLNADNQKKAKALAEKAGMSLEEYFNYLQQPFMEGKKNVEIYAKLLNKTVADFYTDLSKPIFLPRTSDIQDYITYAVPGKANRPFFGEGKPISRLGLASQTLSSEALKGLYGRSTSVDLNFLDFLKQVTGDMQAEQKNILADVINENIVALEQAQQEFADNPEAYDAYADKIKSLENNRLDAINDANQATLDSYRETFREIQNMYIQNADQIRDIQSQKADVLAKIDKLEAARTFNRYKEEYLKAKKDIELKYGDKPGKPTYAAGQKLIAQEATKANQKTTLELLKYQEQYGAEFERIQEEYVQSSLNESEKSSADLLKSISELQNFMKQLPVGTESEKLKQILQNIINLRTKQQEQAAKLGVYERTLTEQEKVRVQNQYDLADAMRYVDAGLMSRAAYDSMQIKQNKELIDQSVKNINYLETEAKGKVEETKRTKLLAEEQEKLNNLKQEAYEITKKTLPFQLQEIKNKLAMGQIGQQESQAQVLEAYNNELDRLVTLGVRTAAQDAEYNQILASRNELQLQVAQSTQDYTRILDALIQKQFNVRNSSQAVIANFGNIRITGEDLVSALPALGSAFGSVGSAMAKINPIVQNVMDGLNTVMSIGVKFASANPVMMIAGAVEALGFVMNILTEMIPSQEAVALKNIELAKSFAELEAKIRRSRSELAFLRGEINEYQKRDIERVVGINEIRAQLDELIARRNLVIKKMMGFVFPFPGISQGIINEYRELNSKILELSENLATETAKANKEAEDDSIAYVKAQSEEYAKFQKAKAEATSNSVDDILAEQDRLQAEMFKRFYEEEEAAKKQGLNLNDVYARQYQEFLNQQNKFADERLTATKENNSKLLDAELDLQASLAALTPDKADDIKENAKKQRKGLENEYEELLKSSKGNFALYTTYLNEYNSKLAKIDKDELVDLEENEANKRQAYRETLLLEAENSGDRRKILEQETKNKLGALEDWKKGLEAAGEYSVDKQREYAAKRVDIERNAADKAKQFAVEQFNELKTIRQQILETQSKQYEQNILKQEQFLLRLNKERDDLQREIEYYDAQIAKLRGEFDEQDKGLFQKLLTGVDLPAEIRKGLEFIANPTGVPNTRFSRQTQREAIKEQIDLLRQRNQNALDLEEISSTDYWKEESRIASIQGAAANAMLTDSTIVAKLTAKEKLEIQTELADAYKRFQEAELKQIEDKYIAEKTANEKRLANLRLDEIERTKIIDDNKYELDLLKQQYDQDINSIDLAMNKLNDSHKDLVFNLQDVQKNLGNMSPILNKITAEWQQMNRAMSGATTSIGTSKFPSGAKPVSGGAPIPVVPGKTAPEGYNVTDGNYWYQTTSDMLGIGLKDGGILGMIPDQDKYRGDKFPIMPGVMGDAGELLVSPLDRLRDLMPSSNNFSIMVTGNVFQDDVDFERVMRNVFKEQNMRNSMSSGQFYSNLRR